MAFTLYAFCAGTHPGFNMIGTTVYLDPFTLFAAIAVTSSATGTALLPLPLPPNQTWGGYEIWAQAFFMELGGPMGFSSTSALHVAICR